MCVCVVGNLSGVVCNNVQEKVWGCFEGVHEMGRVVGVFRVCICQMGGCGQGARVCVKRVC